MGPALPRKGKGGDNCKSASQRRLTDASRDGASVETASSVAISPTATKTGLKPNPNPTPCPIITSSITPPGPTNSPDMGSAPTVVPEEDAASATLSKTASVSTGDDWNFKRYQREDEELWGHEFSKTGQKLMDAIKQAGTTAGRFVESKLGIEKQVTEEDRYSFYFSPRNPPVNDYHPPVVSSKPIHKDGLRWMLQPPPPAKVMEGKVPVSRTASMMSVGSRRTVGTSDGMSLGRRVGERAFEARIRNGETPYEGGDLHSTSSLNKTRPRRAATGSTVRTRSRRTARSHSISESEDSSEGIGRRRARRPSHPRPVATPELNSEDSEDEYISRSLESMGNSAHLTHAAQRSRLSTILSSSVNIKTSPLQPKKSLVPSRPVREVTNTSQATSDAEGEAKDDVKEETLGAPIVSNASLKI